MVCLAAVGGLAISPALQRVVHRLSCQDAVLGRLRPGGADVARRPGRYEHPWALGLLVAALFAAVTLVLGSDPALPAYLYLVAVCVTLAVVDLRIHRLPDVLTLPSYPVAVSLLGLAALLGSSSGSFGRALLGGGLMYLLYLGLRLAHPAGLGFGDVKLSGVLGLYTGWLGWDIWSVGLVCICLGTGAAGLVLLVLGRGGRKARFAMGPFLVAGALAAVLVGPQIAHAYRAVVGLPT